LAAPKAKAFVLCLKMKRFDRSGLIYPNDLIIKILHLSDKVAVILTFAQFIDLLH